MLRQRSLSIIAVILSLAAYLFIAFEVERWQTTYLFLSLGILFAFYLLILKTFNEREILFWISVAILFRLVFLLAIPSLSDDFYRFIWDGRLLAAGYHPFSELPRFYIEHKISIPGIDNALFTKLNSPDYFTIYPPVDQFVFWLSAKLFPSSILGSVLTMRVFVIMAEVGSLLMLKRLLKEYRLPQKNLLLYALNPLVIIELTGNLHLESFMIFFLLLSFWLLKDGKFSLSAISFALAICSKLVPIILLPLLIARLGWKKSIQYYLLVGITCLILFFPLLNMEIVSGFTESIGYYFKKFEFNASIYYLVREYGFWQYGYNIIQTAGWKLALWSTMIILVYTFIEGFFSLSIVGSQRTAAQQLPISHRSWTIDYGLMTSYLFIFAIYFSFATIVHPWYISTLVAFTVFSQHRFAIVWSILIFLTYVGYSVDGFSENHWLIALEYASVIGYLAYELVWKREKQLV